MEHFYFHRSKRKFMSLSLSVLLAGRNERFEPPLLPRCFRSGTLFISDTRNSLVRYYIEFPALQLNDTARLSTWHDSPFLFLPPSKRIAPFSPFSQPLPRSLERFHSNRGINKTTWFEKRKTNFKKEEEEEANILPRTSIVQKEKRQTTTGSSNETGRGGERMTRFPPSRKPRKKTSPRARGYIRGVDRARKSRNAAQLHHQGARTTSSRGMEGRREMHYGTVCATFIPSARWNFLSFSERVKRVVLESRRRAESGFSGII